MEVTAKDGQTIADIAVQEFGSMEASMELARVNGMGVTEIPGAGRVLKLPDGSWNKTMASWCKSHGVSPATERDTCGAPLGIFTEEFTEEFE